MGRTPSPEDLLIPSVRGRHKGQPANTSSRGRAFKADCVLVGIEPRKQYAKRHTMIRLLRNAGAERDVVRWSTHAPPTSTYDGYADVPPWNLLCAEFLKLPFPVGVDAGVAVPPKTESDQRKHRGIEPPDRSEGCVPTDFEDRARHQSRSCFRR